MTATTLHPATPHALTSDASTHKTTQRTEDLAAGLRALVDPALSTVVITPPADGPGSWAGAPCAVVDGATVWLAYRLRRPIGSGRGFANVVAHSGDGENFTTAAIIPKAAFGAESLERPALVHTPEGRWRLYLSCATPGTAHWRVDLIEAASPEQLPDAPRRTVLPGTSNLAVKDPVVVHHDGQWHLWASVHPLEDPAATDRMWTEHATSPDGIDWTWQGPALSPRRGEWDARGVRISAVMLATRTGEVPLAVYDGRATAEQNWEEQTGLAIAAERQIGPFCALGTGPLGTSPNGGGGLRYLSLASRPDGSRRIYGEVTRPDGAHELRTTLLPTHSA